MFELMSSLAAKAAGESWAIPSSVRPEIKLHYNGVTRLRIYRPTLVSGLAQVRAVKQVSGYQGRPDIRIRKSWTR